MIKKVLIGLGVVVLAFLGYVAAQPSHYEISRSVTINASPEKIFPFINNPKLMDTWSPWAEVDPQMKMTYSGPEAGVGAKASWVGEKMGDGSATIVESVPNELVKTKLEYTRPRSMTQDAEISIQKAAAGSVVTWKVSGENPFVGRLVCTFMNMDKMVGGMFEKGLAKLKTKVE